MLVEVRRAAFLTALVATVALAACGGSSAAAGGVKPFDLKGMPPAILDLTTHQEVARVTALKGVKRPYIDKIAFYSLRNGDLLQATLQVSHFTGKAQISKLRFRTSVISQLGATVPKAFRMGDNTVYLTTGRRQSISAWFKGAYLFILSTRDEYPQPRALLRKALEVQP